MVMNGTGLGRNPSQDKKQVPGIVTTGRAEQNNANDTPRWPRGVQYTAMVNS